MGRKKSSPKKSVSFLMPQSHYEIMGQVAEAKGVDVSAILNQLVADAIPGWGRWLADHNWLFSGFTQETFQTFVRAEIGEVNAAAVNELYARWKKAGPIPLADAPIDAVHKEYTGRPGYTLTREKLAMWCEHQAVTLFTTENRVKRQQAKEGGEES